MCVHRFRTVLHPDARHGTEAPHEISFAASVLFFTAAKQAQPSPVKEESITQEEMDTTEKPAPSAEPITNGTAEPEKVEEVKHEEKEEKDELTDEQKAAEKAKPISSTPVPGTPW